MTARHGGDRTHRYPIHCAWTGSTGAGYDHYDRTHVASAPPAATRLELSSDPAFLGDPARLNPEQLVVLAAASCQLLSFLAVAARARVDVLDYLDDGEGVMSGDDPPMRLTSIDLRPTIRAFGTTEQRIRHLVEVAHRQCFIANSLSTPVAVVPSVIIEPPPR